MLKLSHWSLCHLCRRTITKNYFFTPQLAVSKGKDALIFYHPDRDIKYEDTRPLPSLESGSDKMVIAGKSEVLKMTENGNLVRPEPPSVYHIAKKFNIVPRNVHRAKYRIKRKLPGFIDEDKRPLN